MKNKKYMLLSTIVVILLWWLISYLVNRPIVVPSPIDTLEAMVNIVTSKIFLIQLMHSLRRIVIGFVISFFAGVILGMIAGYSNPFYYLLKPIVLVQRAVPTMAIIILAIIWVDRELSTIIVVSLVIFPIIYSSVVTSIREVDQQLLEMARIYGFSRNKKIRHLYLPSIGKSLASVSATSFVLGIKINIAAEVLSQPKYGIGTGFQMEKVALNTAGVFAWAIIAILLAGIFEWLIGRLFYRWAK